MRAIALGLIGLVLLSGTASAAFSITVPDQKQHTYKQTGQTDQDYTFQLTNPPFNLTNTNGAYTNESLYTAQVAASVIQERSISESTSYDIFFLYNDSNVYKAQFYYEKHGWGFFSYWNLYASLQKNGVEVCTEQRTGQFASPTISPNPRFSFDFSLRGSYNSVEEIQAGLSNVSGEVLYNNPSLFLEFRDQLTYASDYSSFFSVAGNTVQCSNSADIGTLGGAIFDTATIELTSAPAVTVHTSDTSGSYTHELIYQFTNKTVTISRTAGVISDINEQREECVMGFAGLCLESLFAAFIGKIFGLAFKPIDWLLSFTPWYSTIKSSASFVFDSIASFYNTVLVIAMEGGDTDQNFPPGGIGIAILVWSLALGFLLWGMTNNPYHIIGLPYWFAYSFVWSIIVLTYGLWIWLPMKGIELVTMIIQNIRG